MSESTGGRIAWRDLVLGITVAWCLWLTVDNGCDCSDGGDRPILRLLMRLAALLMGML